MRPTNVRDEFAELYTAGLFADAGWTVYFPRRDRGFDYIVTMQRGNEMLIRPVQVKGVYPEEQKKGGKPFGKTLTLTAFHPQMVLVMPFFEYSPEKSESPTHVCFLPLQPSKRDDGKHIIRPALLTAGKITIRETYQRYCGQPGMDAVAATQWGMAPSPEA